MLHKTKLLPTFLLAIIFLAIVSVANASHLPIRGIYKVESNSKKSNKKADFVYFNKGITVYFFQDRISYVLKETRGDNKVSGQRIDVVHENASIKVFSTSANFSVESHKVSISLNGNLCKLKKIDTLSFNNIYKNISLKYFLSEEGELTYHYYLNKNADPTDIKVKYTGADGLEVSDEGNLIINNQLGKLEESSPITLKGNKKEVKSNYTLLKNNSISYSIKNFSNKESYIIDPVISYSTYLGGADSDEGTDIVIDDSSNIYGVGTTLSNNFPASPGAFQTSRDAEEDVLIFKMDSTGQLIWATYYGGNRLDQGEAIAISDSGHVYVSGSSRSLVLPGITQNTPGDLACFLLKFENDGTLMKARFFGGSSEDRSNEMIILGDSVFLTGYTSSGNFPVSAISPPKSIGNDAFLSCLDDTLGVVWSRYFGGNQSDISHAMVTDNQGNILIAGETASSDLPILLGNQPLKNNVDDGFIARFTLSGISNYSTYYGGNGIDRISGIGTDNNNNFYIIGSTESTDLNFPAMGNTFQSTYGGGVEDFFLLKYNELGIPQWGTYYGDTASDQGQALAVNRFGSLVITGETESINFPIDTNAIQPNKSTEFDAFIVQFDSSGNRFYASFLGGNGNDEGKKVIYEPNESNYIVYGNTRSTDFPVAPIAFQNNNAGGNDIFIYTNCGLIPNNTLNIAGSDTLRYCSNASTQVIEGTTPLGGSGNYTFEFQQAIGNGPFVAVSNSNMEDLTIDTADLELGPNSFRRIVSDGFCIDTSNIVVVIYLAAPVADFSFDTLCVGNAIPFTDETTLEGNIDSLISWSWSFGDGTTSNDQNPLKTYNTPGTYTVTVTVTASNSCSDEETKSITVSNPPVANFIFDSECENDTVRFTNTSTNVTINEFNWNFGDGKTSTDESPFNVYDNFGRYDVTLIVGSPSGCSDTITQTIGVDSAIVADFRPSTSRCVDSTVSFTDFSSSFSQISSWNWDFGNGATSSQESPTTIYNTTGDFNVKLIVTNSNGCTDSITKVVTIELPPVADFTFGTNCVDQETQFTDISTSSGIINQWLYSFGDGNTSTNQNPTNTYTSATQFTVSLMVTSNAGCSAMTSKNVIINSKPTVVAGEDKQIVKGESVQISATSSSSNIDYSWTPVNSISPTDVPNPTASPDETTIYIVRVTDVNNCFGEDSLTVTVLPDFFVPSVFTPNRDGDNDAFVIEGIDRFPNHTVDIFNRWGSSIYSSNGDYFKNPWDGSYDGEEMPLGAYYYIIDLGDNSELIKGTITILR